MKILHCHNVYRCRDFAKAMTDYSINEMFPLQNMMAEFDIIYLFGRAMIAHEKSYNPLKWLGIIGWSAKLHGTLESYVKRAYDAGVRYIMIEFKEHKLRLLLKAFYITDKYPDITFVWLGEKYRNPYSNIIRYDDFAAQHEITSKDLY